MANEILINHCSLESRVALIIDDVVSEIFIERCQDVSLVGNIYLGTVVRVLPGMQAAFVEIGRERTAFLHIDDMQKAAPMNKPNQPKPKASPDDLIERRLYQGERILVQVIKDELGTKGARLTTNISLPSRYLVYLPDDDNYVGVSTRLSDQKERNRLRGELAILIQALNFKGGLIARTAAEHIAQAKLEEDVYYLLQLWRTILARTSSAKLRKAKHELVYREPSLSLRCIRDLANEHTASIVVDCEIVYRELRAFADEFMPAITDKIHHYTDNTPLFHVRGVESALNDALIKRVDLLSGGYLIIEQTEAMTTIDVNTGSYVGKRSLEETVYKTNLEAAQSIAHQVRLRNLGGIIILDFIDMDKSSHRDAVLEALQSALENDPARIKITGVSELGLVEMTRKRTRESLSQQLCVPCPVCAGKGIIKSKDTIAFDIIRRLLQLASQTTKVNNFTIIASQVMTDYLKDNHIDTINDIIKLTNTKIQFKISQHYHQEQYEVIFD